MVTGIANWLVAERAARNTSSGQADLIEFLRRRGKKKKKNRIKKYGFALPRCPARSRAQPLAGSRHVDGN